MDPRSGDILRDLSPEEISRRKSLVQLTEAQAEAYGALNRADRRRLARQNRRNRPKT